MSSSCSYFDKNFRIGDLIDMRLYTLIHRYAISVSIQNQRFEKTQCFLIYLTLIVREIDSVEWKVTCLILLGKLQSKQS